jgi:hypothetical protein
MKRCSKKWEDANNKAGKSIVYMYVYIYIYVANEGVAVN